MIIGICGGTGSGKTTVANRILESVSACEVAFLQQDSYYRNLDQMPLDFRQKVNFDHPDAIDNDLLVEHVRALSGVVVELPLYDFKSHARKVERGGWSRTDHYHRRHLDLRDSGCSMKWISQFLWTRRTTFVHPASSGATWRSAAGRLIPSSSSTRHCAPMHMQFVEPTQRIADVIIPEGGPQSSQHRLITKDSRASGDRTLARTEAAEWGGGGQE